MAIKECWLCKGAKKRSVGGLQQDCQACDGKGSIVTEDPVDAEESTGDDNYGILDTDTPDQIKEKVRNAILRENGLIKGVKEEEVDAAAEKLRKREERKQQDADRLKRKAEKESKKNLAALEKTVKAAKNKDQ